MAREQRDWMTEAGATALADIIREVWLKRGYAIDTWVVPVSVPRKSQHWETWAVRSDMVDGRPASFGAGV